MLRRDFTINTLAIRLNKNYFGELIDTFGGIDDIEKVLLRPPQILIRHFQMILLEC